MTRPDGDLRTLRLDRRRGPSSLVESWRDAWGSGSRLGARTKRTRVASPTDCLRTLREMTAKAPELDLDGLLAVAQQAVERAAAVLLGLFRSPDLVIVSKCAATDIVTDADVAAESACREAVLGARPTDGFLGEEEGESHGRSSVRWILDPLDSTASFLRGIPNWSIGLAAVDAKGSAVAVVACLRTARCSPRRANLRSE